MHSLVDNIGIEQSLAPQTIQASALNSGNIDTLGSDTLAITVLIGAMADTLSSSVHLDLKIEHADDDGTGSPGAYAACADTDVLHFSSLSGAGVFLSLTANSQTQKRCVIGYTGGKRFVRVTATPVSLTTGGPIAMLALKGSVHQLPVANA
ncbi:MAG: hypothetical protein HY052_02480 [Proteobacteria bacterium]|nr:hypothetical protein [Pseudomonadota bacterium]